MECNPTRRFHPGKLNKPTDNNTMTADTITEYTVLDLRNQLRLAIETLDDLLRDIRNSDETPEGAADRVATEVEKITALA